MKRKTEGGKPLILMSTRNASLPATATKTSTPKSGRSLLIVAKRFSHTHPDSGLPPAA
jgi:hypothetical protein